MTEEEFFRSFSVWFEITTISGNYFLCFLAAIIGASAIGVGCAALVDVWKSWVKRKGSD